MRTPTFTIMDNEMYIGEIPVSTLVNTYGTPLYVKNEQVIEENALMFLNHFQHTHIKSEVIYASKAFCTVAMLKLINQLGLSVDVVSAGELLTALKANVAPSRIYFHGNNKSEEELLLALKHQVGTIVIDNAYEYHKISQLNRGKQKVSLMLRVNPGIDAHTHEYIATSKHDSKFGLSIYDTSTRALIKELSQDNTVDFVGIHSHIGSQIFSSQSYMEEVSTLTNYMATLYHEDHITFKKLNLGGGFGIKYTHEDSPLNLPEFLQVLIQHVYTSITAHKLPTLTVCIEPGRSIVAEAGITLYRISTDKETLNGKNYCFIDGSMADHIRTALYQAEYLAILANRANEPANIDYTITGKACESGDIIIHHCPLPKVNEHDILAVLSTGAYHYSMASNYNRLLKPPVVFVKYDQSRLVVRRETYEDLFSTEVIDA